eukprot:7666894-Alexandrium_andersonii.AAC.1
MSECRKGSARRLTHARAARSHTRAVERYTQLCICLRQGTAVSSSFREPLTRSCLHEQQTRAITP